MGYLQDRLRVQADRFNELNGELVIYVRNGLQTPNVLVHPILHKPLVMLAMGSPASDIRTEMQCWGIDIPNLPAFPPGDTDQLIRPNGETYRVAKNAMGDSHWEYVTSRRDRILLYTKRIKDAT